MSDTVNRESRATEPGRPGQAEAASFSRHDLHEKYLPRNPIPFDRFREDLGQLGLRVRPDEPVSDDLLRLTDGTDSMGATRTEQGSTLLLRNGEDRAEGMLAVIGHHFGTDFVRERDGGLDELRGDRNRGYLEGLGVRELMTRAGKVLRRLRFDRLWLAHPFAARASSDLLDLTHGAHLLLEVEQALGRRLVKDFEADGMTHELWECLCLQVGSSATRGFYADVVRDQEQELAWWSAGDWFALREAGRLSDGAYQGLRQAFPDGNPRGCPRDALVLSTYVNGAAHRR
jgi:hypothetical protein